MAGEILNCCATSIFEKENIFEKNQYEHVINRSTLSVVPLAFLSVKRMDKCVPSVMSMFQWSTHSSFMLGSVFVHIT